MRYRTAANSVVRTENVFSVSRNKEVDNLVLSGMSASNVNTRQVGADDSQGVPYQP